MPKRIIGNVETAAMRYGVENFANIPADILEIPVYLNPRLRTTLGRAVVNRRTGERWIELHPSVAADPEQGRLTLAHEIAHQWAGIDAGHGMLWKVRARQLGHTGQRTATAEAADRIGIRRAAPRARKLVAVCGKCGAELRRAKRLQRNAIYTHPGCGGVFRKV